MALAERFDRLGDTWYGAQNHMTIAWTYLYTGDVASSSRWFVRALAGSNALRDVAGTTIALPLAAVLANRCRAPGGRGGAARRARHLGELYGVKAPMSVQDARSVVSDPRTAAIAALGEEGFARGLRARTADDARARRWP